MALLRYVNEEQHLVPAFSAAEEEATLSLSDEMQLRNALWANDGLRERFVTVNPARLDPADLAVVASWQYRRAGSFYIVRAVKKYTVFLSEESPPRAYGVLGLSKPSEQLARGPLPVFAQAVLLPFEDQIIYEGQLQWYAVVFGPEIRTRLNDDYHNAREREGITTTLGPARTAGSGQEERTAILARNARIVQAFRTELSRKMVQQYASTIEDFVHTSLLDDELPRGLLEMQLADVQV